MVNFGGRLGLNRYEADEYYQVALEAFSRSRLEDALQNIGHAINLLPDHAEYYAARGLFYLQDGVEQNAHEDFEAALSHNAYEMLAHYGLGVLAYRAKKWDDALQHFVTAWSIEAERPEVMYYIALIAHRKGDNVRALGWMQSAVSRFERNSEDRTYARYARDAARWVREFEKIVERETAVQRATEDVEDDQ